MGLAQTRKASARGVCRPALGRRRVLIFSSHLNNKEIGKCAVNKKKGCKNSSYKTVMTQTSVALSTCQELLENFIPNS